MVKKIIFSALFLFLFFYLYICSMDHLNVSIGHDSTTKDVIVVLDNKTKLPMIIKEIVILNENKQSIDGEVYQFQLNGVYNHVYPATLAEEEWKSKLNYYEPFHSVYLKGNDDTVTTTVSVINGNYVSLSKVIVKFYILGIFPFEMEKQINMDI